MTAIYLLAFVGVTGLYFWRIFVLQEAFKKRHDQAAGYWRGHGDLWDIEKRAMREHINGQIEENRRLRSRLEKAKTALWDDKNGSW